LHPKIDRVLERERLGLELKLLQALKMHTHAEKIEAVLKTNLNGDVSFIHRRIMARAVGEYDSTRIGMDPLGDLMDVVKADPEKAVEQVLETQFLQIFYDVLKLDRQSLILYVDLRPGLVLGFEKGEVIAMDGLTSLLRKVLKVLSQNAISKEEIFQKAWGFQYDSLRHDTVIYAAINSIRRLLGAKAHWLETVESGYRLNPELQIVFHKLNEVPVQQPVVAPGVDLDEPLLNYRQLEIIGHLASHKFIDVQQCKKMFEVSDITASRDLSTLTVPGAVMRIRACQQQRVEGRKFSLPGHDGEHEAAVGVGHIGP
jgi:hypothetical protein